ncbi:MAG TPA: aminotransferase class IV [bacterium]|nr:aminotransferase class IV [bacterium]
MSAPLFLDGRLVPEARAAVSPLSSAALFGESLFESLPVYGGKPLFLDDHLGRLRKGCAFLGWPMPPAARFRRAIGLFHRVHSGDFIIRFNLAREYRMPVHPRTRGEGPPRLWAFIRPLTHGPGDFWPLLGPVGVSPWRVPDRQSAPNQFKWAFYMMTRRAYHAHPGWKEMVRVNAQGYAVDGAGSGVMWFDGKKVRVPPRAWVGLESVTQNRVRALCGRLGVRVVERPWRPRETLRRGELIFTGSGVGVMGATHLNGARLPGPPRLALRLWQYYRDWARDPDGAS